MATKRRSRRRHPARLARIVAGTASAGLAIGLVIPLARATGEVFDERADQLAASQVQWALSTAADRAAAAAATRSTVIDQPVTSIVDPAVVPVTAEIVPVAMPEETTGAPSATDPDLSTTVAAIVAHPTAATVVRR